MNNDSAQSISYQKWKEAVLNAFKEMDKLENLDCSCSGTIAVFGVKQVNRMKKIIIIIPGSINVVEYIMTILINRVNILYLGDSRAVLGTICDGEITAVQLTTDLKPGLPRLTIHYCSHAAFFSVPFFFFNFVNSRSC